MTKIDIFSGFLGAGKTTLLKKLIKEAYAGEKLVLIENEFGEIGIDGGFMQDAGIEITEMNSGCICCSLVGDFGKALEKVLNEFSPDRILIEPSGVGKLSDVVRAVEGVTGTNAVRNSAVTVVDVNKCKMYMKNFGEFFCDQVENAECIVLSHTGKCSDEKIAATIALLREHNESATVITTDWDALTGAQMLAAMEKTNTLKDELKQLEEEAHHHHHEHGGCCCGKHEHDHDDHDEHDHDEEEHEHHCCGKHGHHHEHDHDEHDEHDHDEEEHEHHCCGKHGHHHEHDHGDHDEHDHDEEEHEHHHDHHDHHDHHHDHHHEHGENCTCGCHDHEHDHHHEHDENCTCGCHDHHHHHHADEVFTSWGTETTKKFSPGEINAILEEFSESDAYGMILRAKGIVESTDGSWIHFDYVPGEPDVRTGGADVCGKLCVIGSGIHEYELKTRFGV